MSRVASPPPRRPAPSAASPGLVKAGSAVYNVASDADPVGKIRAASAHAQRFVVGRRVVVDLLELALIAGSNVLLFGPPGTAKTLAVDIFASCIHDSSVFNILLSKFTKPAEVFGPMDLEAFKRGKLKTNTTGYLPTATVAVVDEIFKGSSAILNTLLPAANERRFHDDGQWQDIPLRMIVGMSNELPEDATVLAAIYDRFPLKFWAEYLDESDFASMLDAPRWSSAQPVPAPVTITDADFAEITRRLGEVVIPPEVKQSLVDIRRMLKAQKIVASDRRYMQALNIVRASAVRRGSSVACSDDLRPLRYILWNDPAQAKDVDTVVSEFVSPMGKAIKEQLQELAAARSKIMSAAGAKSTAAEKLAAATQAAAREIAGVRNIAQRLAAMAKTANAAEQMVCNLAAKAAENFVDSAHAMTSGGITYQEFVTRTETDLTVDFT